MNQTTFSSPDSHPAKSVLSAIAEFLLGKKYYAVIINTRGTNRCEISSIIFPTLAAAEKHKNELSATFSYQWVETISFRSRNDYSSEIKRYNTQMK
ncbi:hypothetical protein [Muribaculum intestinale]|uniref:Uncharacterized protein n=1 Tax=Muribaculum intestinale TaxID=1796646 RepID=A0A4S2FXJ5_9BACT|nr:hypothetical protein [Muribaculum intestinale]MYM12892.1 hypothetical protein [Muribaculum intestinale]TGY74104.1 hypothetical protein E5333_07460 [Muribaculum intestinale]